MPDTSQILEQAYDLINRGDLLAGKQLLQPAINANTPDPDIWWLYAHATEDADEGRKALMKVISLDPEYPQANELIKEYDALQGQNGSLQSRSKLNRPQKRANRRLLPILLLLTAIIVLIAFVLMSLNPFQSATPAEPTDIAMNLTPTENLAQALPTDEPITFDDVTNIPLITLTSENPLGNLAQNLAAFSLMDEDPIRIETSTLGETLRVEVCAPDTANGRQQQLTDVMTTLAGQLSEIPPNVQALAVALTNCAEDTAIRTVATPLFSANAFASGEITLRDFQATWIPIE